ncbi:MAG TPA: Zn-ribbon domain-containing OB-fold protein [Hyphomicrobiaceae bacterium]|nr:Zn-ribbon domain-containing OB-fold protein [Hyphomicrobiaceae bacterium]
MSAETIAKPIPQPSQESKPFWDGLLAGKLLLQTCGSCGKVRHYPRPICPSCYSFEVRWSEAKGRGLVHSWTVTHHPFHPGFKGEVPFTLVTVDLPEGVRMQAPLRGAEAASLKLGAPVRLVIERPTAELALPAFVLDKA